MHKKFFIVTEFCWPWQPALQPPFSPPRDRTAGSATAMVGCSNILTRELNLTEAQQAQIKGILADARTRTKPLMQQLRQNEQAQNAAVNGNFDETQARAFAGKQAQIMSDLIVEKQRTKSPVYSVLTPDQRQKALQLMQQHAQRRQERLQKKSEQQQMQSR